MVAVVAPLRLERFIPWRSVRQLVWRHLTPYDREIVRCAQNATRTPRLDWTAFMRLCAKTGNIPLAAWARAKWCGNLNDYYVCTMAAECDQWAFLKWARNAGFPWEDYVCERAARWGNLRLLQLLRAFGCPYDHAYCVRVAYDHPDVLEWLRMNE